MLGRRLTTDDSQHKSDISSFLKHHGNEVTDAFFQTNYMLSHTEKTPQPAQHRLVLCILHLHVHDLCIDTTCM